MNPRRVLLVATLAVATVALVAARSERQNDSGQVSGDAVRLLTGTDIRTSRHLSADERGATYYWLEGLAHKVTVQFPDAVATTERGADGALRTRLADRAGNELATFDVSHAGAESDVLDYRAPAQAPVLAARRGDVHATLAWSGRQAYRLWQDARGGPSAPLEWRDGFMRRAGSARHDRDDDTEQITTEWADGLTATVTRVEGARHHVLTGTMLPRAHAVVSRFHQNGTVIGVVAWYPEEQVLSWNFPNMTTGYVDPTRLKRAGGWTFTPDMAWASVQGFAFEHFHQEIAAHGFVARAGERPTLPARLASFFAPALAANEPGCDDLHWLDGTVFRYCCDMHDQCYETDGCTAGSWWQWWKSWSCDNCNMTVIVCFFDGGDTPWGPRWF